MLGDSDGECCESESCQKWPEIFKEAKAGCNQTSIHDDCPALSYSLQRHCKGRYESVRNLSVTTILIYFAIFCTVMASVHRGNAMFEMSDEDGSRKISRCGYSLVSGQVYKCSSVGSPVQCSSAWFCLAPPSVVTPVRHGIFADAPCADGCHLTQKKAVIIWSIYSTQLMIWVAHLAALFWECTIRIWYVCGFACQHCTCSTWFDLILSRLPWHQHVCSRWSEMRRERTRE